MSDERDKDGLALAIVAVITLLLAGAYIFGSVEIYTECRDHGFSIGYCLNEIL
jgi:hypothetical protein